MQAALLPRVAIVFPLEQGAKKGTSIQEQAITTAVLGVQCADCAAFCRDVTTSLPCSAHDKLLAIAVLNTLSCCKHHASCAGTALAAAILVPNVEFIFGLLGSTASVMIAYMLPAALFLSLSGRPALLKQLNPDDVTTGAAVLP